MTSTSSDMTCHIATNHSPCHLTTKHITSSHAASNFVTSKQVTSPPWNSRRLVHSKEMVWASRWSVALRAFYARILSLTYSFSLWNFRPRLVRALLVLICIYSCTFLAATMIDLFYIVSFKLFRFPCSCIGGAKFEVSGGSIMGIQLRQSFDSKRSVPSAMVLHGIWTWNTKTQGDGRWPCSVHFEFANATSSACEEPVNIAIYFPEKCNQETARLSNHLNPLFVAEGVWSATSILAQALRSVKCRVLCGDGLQFEGVGSFALWPASRPVQLGVVAA